MLKRILYLSIFTFCSFKGIALFAQDTSSSEILNSFDRAVGIQNTVLQQGIVFKENYRTLNDRTQYFLSPRFLKGSVSYAGQDFHGLQMKYDVYDDRILIKPSDAPGATTLELIKSWVQQFTINGRQFIHLDKVNTGKQVLNGFYEKAMAGTTLSLYIKHNRKRIDRKDKKFLYYEFSIEESAYFLHLNEDYHKIDSKKDVLTLFPGYQNQITKFYRNNRNQKRNNPDLFYQLLTQYLDQELTLAE